MFTAIAARGQAHWVVDPKTSLAWWQVDPNLAHLWATTCPGDSSWRPGEGRSGGWYINPALKPPRQEGFKPISDTIDIPLYPRPAGKVYPDCVEAVQGEVSAADTVHWRGVRGDITVIGEALVTGERMRDALMHEIMQTPSYPTIHFTLDSLTDVSRQGDTLIATAVGTLDLHRVKTPVAAKVHAYPDGGGLRVLARFHFLASTLKNEFGFTRLKYLGLGLNTRIWHWIFMGVDVVLKPASAKDSDAMASPR
jgi:hypothetical protein